MDVPEQPALAAEMVVGMCSVSYEPWEGVVTVPGPTERASRPGWNSFLKADPHCCGRRILRVVVVGSKMEELDQGPSAAALRQESVGRQTV
jgi:hypothetical protein